MHTCWHLIIIFLLTDFLTFDLSGFNFGLRQNGERVMDVRLPSWACGDPRLFVLIHRQVKLLKYFKSYSPQNEIDIEASVVI